MSAYRSAVALFFEEGATVAGVGSRDQATC